MAKLRQETQKQILIALIFLMNMGSGYTTVIGAMEIFPTPGAGIMVGIGSQMILFMLLTDLVLKNTPVRKWFIVGVLATFSIYTSYFSYYENIARGENNQKAFDRAVQAHQLVQSTFYTPLKIKYQTAINQRDNADKQRDKEILGKGVTQEKGLGQESQKYAKDSVELDGEIAKLKFVEEVKPYFEFNTKELSPDIILEKDRIALAKIPIEFLPKDIDSKSFINRSNYVEEISNVKFLLPYQRLKQGDKVAHLSLGIAGFIDGVMIFLSTAVESKGNQPFRGVTVAFASWIVDSKSSFKTLVSAIFDIEGKIYPLPDIGNEDLEQGVDYIRLKLRGKGTDFLAYFLQVISESDPREIDRKKLGEHREPTFRTGYGIFLDALCSSKRNWVVKKDRRFFLNPDYDDRFREWINNQLIRQAEYEEPLSEKTSFTRTVRNITMPI